MNPEGLFDRPFCFGHMSGSSHRDTFDVGGAVNGGQEFRHPDRGAIMFKRPAERSCSRFLADQGRRSHLSAGHAVDGVVDEDGRDLFSAHGRVDDFRCSDGGQVPVTLVGKDRAIGKDALDPGCDSGCPAVGGLVHVAIEVIVGKNGATNGSDTDGVSKYVKLHQGFSDQLMNDAVGAAGTVVHLDIC